MHVSQADTIANMVSIVAKFDGEKIEVPAELRGAAPGNVLIVYPAETGDQTTTVKTAGQTSIWSAFGKSPNPRTVEDINEQIKQERDSWGDR